MPIRLNLILPPGEHSKVVWESNQELRIGRIGGRPDLQVALDVNSVSRFQAVIRPTENGYCVIDQGSTNGSWLNGVRLTPMEEYPIHLFDLIQFGDAGFSVTRLNDEQSNPLGEPTWDRWRDPNSMIRTFSGKESAFRKLQLFAVACCRQVGDRLNPETQRILDECECRIDQIVDLRGSRLAELVTNLDSRLRRVLSDRSPYSMAHAAARLVEKSVSADLLREVFFDPWAEQPPNVDPNWLAWNNQTVPKLARTIYEDRRFDLMPILADALEDAMCNDSALVGHCRQEAQHFRGCWALDAILEADPSTGELRFGFSVSY